MYGEHRINSKYVLDSSEFQPRILNSNKTLVCSLCKVELTFSSIKFYDILVKRINSFFEHTVGSFSRVCDKYISRLLLRK